jgi:CDP-paratose 2-epimerase
MDGDTDYLIETNFNGTQHALNFALRHKAKFIFLSTSRVYPIKSIEQIETIETNTRFEIAPDQKIQGISQKGISEDFSLSAHVHYTGPQNLLLNYW